MRPGQVRMLARDPAASHRLDRDVLGLVLALGAEDEPRIVDRADRAIHVLPSRDPVCDPLETFQSIPMEET